MSATKKLFTSAAFSSGAKILQRALGLISTLILARLLTPDDFALIAIVTLSLYFFDVLSQSGSDPYIVQKQQVNNDDLNTSWTLDLLLKLSFFLLFILLASPIAAFFSQPQLVLGLQVASITLVINALRNPGIILFKRDLDYKYLFYLSLVQKIIGFIVVVYLAFTFKNYWAFIIADIVASLFFLVGSYVIHKFRPTLSLLKVREQWRFSKWYLCKNVVGYLRSQVDTIIVAKFFSTTQLGNYHMARDIAMLPAYNLLGPAIEPLLANFKDYKRDPANLGIRLTAVLCIVTFIATPIACFVALYPKLIIGVLLGEQWTLAVYFLPIMTMLFYYYVFLLVAESGFIAIGRVKDVFVFDLLSLFAHIIIFAVFLSLDYALIDLLWVRAIAGICLTLIQILYLSKLIDISFVKIVVNFSTAVFLSIVASVASLGAISIEVGNLASLLLVGLIFSITFLVGIVLFAYLVRSTGIERLYPFEFLKANNRD